jgi:prephenate dehydratase/prephenate dehydrogenase
MAKIKNTKIGSHMHKKKPNILIIGGRGKFGSWFVRFFEKEGIPVVVSGREDGKTLLIEKTSQADIVIVSVPISVTVDVIKTIRDHVRSDALLCDFTSVKEFSMKEMLKTKSSCGVVGIHPMFGPLMVSMKNQTVVFCPGRNNHWVDCLKKLFHKNGARLVNATPKEHDEKMAIVQAFTHFINILFGTIIKDENTEKLNAYSSPVFRLQSILSTRVLGGKADLYADMAMSNPSFCNILKKFDLVYKKLQKIIISKDVKSYEKIYNESAKTLSQLIPIAQATSTELMRVVDRQFISVESSRNTSSLVSIKNSVVHVLGPEGTFSHQAAKMFLRDAEIIFDSTIREVFENVLDGSDNMLGLVPIENSTQGIVQETLDCFTKLPVTTLGSWKMPIHLCLMGNTKNPSDIKIIRSHPQPLAQSRNWIKDNFPDALVETTSSTAKAMLETKDPQVAFIGSIEASKKYNLIILAENIEDKKNNATEFYVISKSKNNALSKKLKASRTALVLVVHDRPGVLKDILEAFSKRKLTLTKLHSKASDLEDYDYYFFLEVEGLVGDNAEMDEALKEIDSYCYIRQVLGVV